MCPQCRGTGICSFCYGKGTLPPGDGIGPHHAACPKCFDPKLDRGTGRCSVCGGLGEIVDRS